MGSITPSEPLRKGPSRAQLAGERRTAKRRKSAEREVERILAVTLELIESTAPRLPAISEIVAAAGISNQTLYRTFPSKSDLMAAVFEHGVMRFEAYLHERMSQVDDPMDKLLEWTRGFTRQVTDQKGARAARAVVESIRIVEPDGLGQSELLLPIRVLLEGPLRELGADPVLDRDCITELATGTMRRHLAHGTAPDDHEIAWLVRFILRGLGREDHLDSTEWAGLI